MTTGTVENWKQEMTAHLTQELLPFWTARCWDNRSGGYVTQFDADGKDSGVDEKSILAHMRMLYSLSLAAQHGFDPSGKCRQLAEKGLRFAIGSYWDPVYEGFYWLFNRKNEVVNEKKIVYGLSFAIYALATYGSAFEDLLGQQYAERCFDLLQKYCTETSYGGYLEMFERDWTLSGPGAGGGDRKTLDVHMHLMEALTALYRCTGKEVHRRKLQEIVDLLIQRVLHPRYRTGIPQFFKDWSIAPQIKFDVIWGWDRFDEKSLSKEHALDNTSYGHNIEFFWLLLDALRTMNVDLEQYRETLLTIVEHSVRNGLDREFGGVYVEGAHDGSKVYDDAKEFWQQAEFLIGTLDAFLLFGDDRYLEAYSNVHEFVMKRMINHAVGEWLPLLSREGKPIWTHMSHSWKVNYHTVRAAVLTIDRLEKVLNRMG